MNLPRSIIYSYIAFKLPSRLQSSCEQISYYGTVLRNVAWLSHLRIKFTNYHKLSWKTFWRGAFTPGSKGSQTGEAFKPERVCNPCISSFLKAPCSTIVAQTSSPFKQWPSSAPKGVRKAVMGRKDFGQSTMQWIFCPPRPVQELQIKLYSILLV